MIGFLRGIVASVSERNLLLDVHGVGYLVGISALDSAKLPPEGEEVTVYTYMSVREDGVSLFGFLEQEDLEIFSDGASHLEMVKKIMLAKFTPMILILISCIMPNYDKMLRVIRNDSPNKADWFSVIGVTFLVLTIAALFCRMLAEFLRLKKKYSKSA